MKEIISQLRVNVKSLAAEAKIIRHEFLRTKFSLLDYHRRGKLRTEARYAQLALAFLRKTPYSQVEAKCQVKPIPEILNKKLRNFTRLDQIDQVKSWLA